MKKSISLVLVVIAIVLVVFAGCKSQTSNNNGGTGVGANINTNNDADAQPSSTTVWGKIKCRGTVVPCEQLDTQQCRLQKGCWYHSVKGCIEKESGLVPCENITSEIGCGKTVNETQFGCYWG